MHCFEVSAIEILKLKKYLSTYEYLTSKRTSYFKTYKVTSKRTSDFKTHK